VFCENCEHALTDGQKECPNCFEPVVNPTTKPSELTSPKSINAKDEPRSMSSGGKGSLVASGNGKDVNIAAIVGGMVIAGVVVFIILSIVIGFISDYHVGGFMGPRLYGIRFGDRVIPPYGARVSVAMILSGFVLAGILHLVPKLLNSELCVYGDKISGVSEKKETFTLKYAEISSVDTQDDGLKSININASGRIYRVYTVKCKEIAAEINKRRNM